MVINHKNRIFFRFLNVFKFALSICLLVPICRGNVHMYFENIDEPGRSGVEVRWSGAFQHSGNAIPYSGKTDFSYLSIGTSSFFPLSEGQTVGHQIFLNSSPMILYDRHLVTQIPFQMYAQTGFQFGFLDNGIYTDPGYISNSFFEGSLFIPEARLEDYDFKIGHELVIPFFETDDELIITIIPEAQTYALIVGAILILFVFVRRIDW